MILKESAATALVDGCDALGATVGNFCMDVAIRKAQEAGVGWVAARRKSIYCEYIHVCSFLLVINHM